MARNAFHDWCWQGKKPSVGERKKTCRHGNVAHLFHGASWFLLKQNVHLEEGPCLSMQLSEFSQTGTAPRMSAPATPCQGDAFSLIYCGFGVIELHFGLRWPEWTDPYCARGIVEHWQVCLHFLVTVTLRREALLSTAAGWKNREKVLQEPHFVSLCCVSGTLRSPVWSHSHFVVSPSLRVVSFCRWTG